MIRRSADLRASVRHEAKGGKGDFINHHILESDELYGAARLYTLCRLAPGHSVGSHIHIGEMEVCYFLSGTGLVETNGESTPVGPGDTNIVLDGENHSVLNNGTEELVYTALILYHIQR